MLLLILGSSWHRAVVPIGSQSSYRVAFEGIIDGNFGDTAIDDVSFTPGCIQGGKLFYFSILQKSTILPCTYIKSIAIL